MITCLLGVYSVLETAVYTHMSCDNTRDTYGGLFSIKQHHQPDNWFTYT